MRLVKCIYATQRKWNLSNMLQNEKECKDGIKGGDEDQWKQSAEELKTLSASQKCSERWTDVSRECETRHDSRRGQDSDRRR